MTFIIPMRRPILAVALLLAAAPLAAQKTAPDPRRVPGFPINWGATREEVSTYWRETPSRETHERGVSLLDFEPWEGMTWTVAVHDEQGLIGIVGTSLADLTPQGCDRVFDAWLADMRRSFSGVSAVGQRSVPPGESACAAVKAGRGTVSFSFAAPRSGTVATLWIDRADGLARYVIGTQAFREWAGVEGIAQSMGLSGPAPAEAAPARPAPAQSAPATAARNLGVTERAFRAIRPGATYADVVAIVGREGERAAAVAGDGASSETFVWRDGPLMNIGVTFHQGKAIMTLQMGLPNDGPTVTAAQFDQLREGMTYEEVARVMGSPGLYNGFTDLMGHVSESYLWRGRAPASSVSASFSGGRMRNKLQLGLH